ncbi:translocation/assembly module TamB domain-containing protein [Bacteroides sp.]|uniref:translocation/assembly module TamB domain-containing protein n=2 Tax=Bacteroides TaxID=816 RepID=UPI00258BA123|nr:translocation/assembly module TamB domain-containing protein [Bacteroides sp.]
MKKFLKWCGIIISIPFALFIIISILIYIPPIQNFAVRKAASIASDATGMDISVGRISLSFPLNLGIHNVTAIQKNDTLLSAGKMTLKVQMKPLFRKQIEVDALKLESVSVNTKDMIEGFMMKGKLGELYLESHGVALSPETATINSFIIKDTHVDISIADTTATDTTASEPLYWKFMLQKANFENVAVNLSMPLDSMDMGINIGSAVLTEGIVDLKKEAYSLQKFKISNSSAQYIIGEKKQTEGFNPSFISLAGLNIDLSSIYYCGNAVNAEIKDFRMKEHSGLEITSAGGKITANDEKIEISGLELKTTDSYFSVQANADWNISQINNDGSISARIMADIGKNDLFRFVTDMPEDFKKDFPAEPIQIRAGIDGSINEMKITAVSAEIPEHVKFTAGGYVNDLPDSTRMSAHLDMDAVFPDMSFAKYFIGTAVIPSDMVLKGSADIRNDSISALLGLTQGEGAINLNAGFIPKTESFFAKMDINELNIHNFMPSDSLFRVTASLMAEGKGFDIFSPTTKMGMEAGISCFEYASYSFSGINMKAGLENCKSSVALNINDNTMEIGSTLNANISAKEIAAQMRTDIKRLDLHGLGLIAQPFKIGQIIDIDAHTDMNNRHRAKVSINNIKLMTEKKTFKTKDLNFGVSMTEDSLRTYINSGDMTMLLRTTGGIDKVTEKISKISELAAKQWENKLMDLEALRTLLPETSFRLFAGDDNPFANTLEMRNIGFKRLYASLNTSENSGINSSAYLYGLHTDSLRLDTITFRASQDSTGIIIAGGVKANQTKQQEAFSIALDGGIFNDNAHMLVKYDNAQQQTGALIGMKAVLRDKGISLHMLPENPILVYRKFHLNDENYIFLSDKGRIHADMRLNDDNGTGLQIYSVPDSTVLQDVTVNINKLDIGEFRRIIPYMPPVEGIINAEAHYVQQKEDMFMTAFETDVNRLAYGGKPLGNWTMSAVYLPMENSGHHVDGYITHNGNTLAEINGQYNAPLTEEEEDKVNAHLSIYRFPLALAGAFVPEEMAQLKGYAGADISLSGSTSAPVIDGSVTTDSVNVFIPMTSMNLRFENKPITVKNNKLMFDKYSIFSRGKNPYIIDGSVDFANMENMYMDLKMTARNFEVFNSKKNRTSMVYGKMYIDLNTTIKGTPDAISVKGNANILGSSDFTYILRESPLTVEDRLAETVTFVNFADTASARRKPLQEMRPGGIDMLVNLHIDQAVQCRVDINESGSNYMEVEGGGDLAFQYTPDGNMLLNGRYQLMSGEMKYEMPVIPLKTFKIREGSYIEWTGNVMDPKLNIQAYERTRASVTQEGQAARMVSFDVGVSITNRLNDLGFEFTIEAPEDGSMQNELAAMSASQKNKAAVTMLVTGMYISDSSTAKLDANSALNSYLQGQINSIAGNALKTIDLSVGMETTNATETGDTRTDYNFQFAKRFWNNRVRVVIGGKISTGNAAVRDESFIDNISLEYRLDNSGTRYVKLFHDKKYANVLEGEVTETGAGIVLKKKVSRIKDLFIFQRKKKKINETEEKGNENENK